MQILSVTLKNFKSHRDRHFTFQPGTNAICGENGAGKTSILEAIAWVMFNYKGDYKVEDLIHNDSSSAQVSVRFISNRDGRTYDVHRCTARGYTLYDPQLNERLNYKHIEQEVLPWLRQHLGVLPGTDLARLFANTIGVPQGTFTADFLLPTEKRKPVFDGILKLEEYRKANMDLRSLEQYARANSEQVERQIADYEDSLKELPPLAAKHQQLTLDIAAAEVQLQNLQTQIANLQSQRQQLAVTAQTVQMLANQLQQVSSRITGQQQTIQVLEQAMQRAQTAQNLCDIHHPGYLAYEETQQQILALEQELQPYTACVQQRQQVQSQLDQSQTELTRLSLQLEALARYQAELQTLAEPMQQQTQLEDQLKLLNTQLNQAAAWQISQQTLRSQVIKLQEDMQALEQAIARAQTAQNLCELHYPGYLAYQETEQQIATLEPQVQPYTACMQQRQQIQTQLSQSQTELTRLKLQMETLATHQTELDGLAELIQQQTEAEQQLTEIAAQLNQSVAWEITQQTLRNQMTQLQAETDRLATEIARLQQLEATLSDIPELERLRDRRQQQLTRVEAARQFEADLQRLVTEGRQQGDRLQQQTEAALTTLSQLQATIPLLAGPSVDAILATLKTGAALNQELLAGLQAILDDLADQVDTASLQTQLKTLKSQLEQVYRQQAEVNNLPTLQTRHRQLLAELAEHQTQLQEVTAQLAEKPAWLATQAQLTVQLQTLADPRGRATLLRQQLAQHSQLEADYQQVLQTHQTIEAAIADLDQQLAHLADLQTQLATLKQDQQTHRDSYFTYVQAQQEISTLVRLILNQPVSLPPGEVNPLAAAQTRHCQLLAELTQHQTQLQEVTQQLDQQSTWLAQQAELTAQLQRLADPKGRAKLLQQQLAQQGQLEADYQQVQQSHQAIQAAIADLDAQLVQFANLQTQLADLKQAQQTHQASYLTYVQSQQIASTLPALTRDQQIATQELQALQTQEADLKQQFDQWNQEYDPQQLKQLDETIQAIQRQIDQFLGALPQQRKLLEELSRQLTELQAVAEARDRARHDLKRRDQIRKFITFARKAYKEAGPRIADRYVRSISHEADRLFRELLNRPNVALTWTADYEILVQDGAHNRRFVNLSGGEQMCAALAVRLALLRILADMDIAFFDEPTTNMDRPRRESLAEAICNIKSFRQLFVISHDDTFEKVTENVIVVARDQ